MRHTEIVAAFNFGADARLDGFSLADCPFKRTGEELARASWQRGWSHVHVFWAVDVRRRWETRRLRPLRTAS